MAQSYAMQQYGVGSNDNIGAQVDPTYAASRVNVRPAEWQSSQWIGGHYLIGAQTGTMAAGIASLSQVFQVRWADPSKLFILKKLSVQCATLTGFAATSLGCPLELIIGHGSTANGAGGTPLAPNSISNRMRGSMAPTAFVTSGEIRISATAALTAATGQVLEPSGISECLGAPNATLAQSPLMNLFEQREMGTHPLILVAGDTLAVRALNPAGTGTWVAAFTMAWMEANTY